MTMSEDITATVVIETNHGSLRIPAEMLALWDAKGWLEDHVLAEMVTEDRWRP